MNKPYSLSSFDAIIFDLGAVIIDIDYQTTIQAFEDLGFKPFAQIFSKAQQSNLTDNFEMGRISPSAFFKGIKELWNVPATEEDMLNAWNAMLGSIPQQRVDLLHACRAKKPTFLLSNTNQSHIEAINIYLEKSFSIASLKPWFDKVYLSFEQDNRKPNISFFEGILKEHHLDAPKVLFIDDSPQHIQAARSIGIVCHHLLDDEEVCELVNV